MQEKVRRWCRPTGASRAARNAARLGEARAVSAASDRAAKKFPTGVFGEMMIHALQMLTSRKIYDLQWKRATRRI